jgi:hypothetical protein
MKQDLLAVVAFFVASTSTSPATSAVIYESATLGPTGIGIQQLLQGAAQGTNVADSNFAGARFRIDQPVATTAIGGHFIRGLADESFFGAIVQLTDEFDFPNSGDLSTMDVVGVTALSFPHPSNEAFGQIAVILTPGWYAVVFGSGQFETTGWGGTINNGLEIGAPNYILWQPSNGWFNLVDLGFPGLGNLRLVVEGTVVPEPSIVTPVVIAALMFSGRKR